MNSECWGRIQIMLSGWTHCLNQRPEPFHKFVVNTSGSGKTKLSMEGLCKYWGIYFAAKTDMNIGLGSGDMQNIIDETIAQSAGFSRYLSDLDAGPDFNLQLEDNVEIAQHHFRCLLFARLRVLSMFLEIIDSIPSAEREPEKVYRTRWLALQLRPFVLGVKYDIFLKLTVALTQGFSDSLSQIRSLNLVDAIRGQLLAIFGLCTTQKKDSTKYIYLVVDEVQYAVEKLYDAFRADRKPTNGKERVAADSQSVSDRKDPRNPAQFSAK
ncbi:hypothetical protein B0H12DRAFT_1241672 [Mycena haematopus]|nr:hypothetical protein B0H12DRAFT_1241672 [Mycena haematopus]